MADKNLPMPPAVAIVGRPNVGKSLLFNRLCGRRAALVHNAPGMTLDYLSETAALGAGRTVQLMDTGGVQGEENEWSEEILQRMLQAAESADCILVVVDAAAGIRDGDGELLLLLRRRFPTRPRLLLVNKSEGMSAAAACADFYGFKEEMIPVSAKRGGGLSAVRKKLAEILPAAQTPKTDGGVSLAIVGRPNVGKSTLLNCILQKDRAIVSEIPGTTRDNICAQLSSPDGDFTLIDTAGMRRRRANSEREKFSVAAARDSLRFADAVFFVWDTAAGATYQDRKIAALVAAAGRGVVMLGNKSDLLPAADKNRLLRRQAADLHPGCAAKVFAISAVSGKLPGGVLAAAASAAAAAKTKFSTAGLNRALAETLRRNPPPMSGGIRPKLRYIHQGGQSPLRVIIHGGGVARIAEEYRRYLSSALARRLSVVGAPLLVDFRAEENPFVRN